MREYGFFHAFFMPFFSTAFYRDVGRQWRGVGFLFLLVLLALCWIPATVKVAIGLREFAGEEASAAMAEIPDIEIKDGVVHADVKQPHVITIDEHGEEIPFAIIDTTGEYTSLEGTEAFVLLTRDKLHMRNERKTEVHDLSQIKEFSLTQAKMKHWLHLFTILLPPVMYIGGVLFSFCYRMLVALIYGLIGLLVANVLKVSLTYESLVRLAVMAMTPLIILGTVHKLFGSPIPGILWWFICVSGTIAYLILGVKACRSLPEPDILPPPSPISGPSGPLSA